MLNFKGIRKLPVLAAAQRLLTEGKVRVAWLDHPFWNI